MTELAKVFHQNLSRLRERDPDLAERLDSLRFEVGSEGIEVLPSRSGHLTARVTRNGSTLFVHSSVDPVMEAERWAASQDIPPKGRVVLLGLGLGYQAVSLLNRLNGGHLIIVEPSLAMVRAALHNPAVTQLLIHPSVTWLVGPWQPNLATRLWNAIRTLKVEQIRVLDFPSRSRLDPATFAHIAQEVTAVVRSLVVNNNTLRRFAGQWAHNLLANLPVALGHPPASLLFDKFRGVPAIIVAAGPSLNRNVAMLAEARDRALILAVGTALKPLLRAGIRPHMVITIDGSEANFHHFRDVTVAGVPLLYDVTCYPAIPAHWQGPGLTLSSEHWFSAWVGQYVDGPFTPYNSGPSVSNAALDVAAKMGCDPIIFVGLDLGYTGGQSHAEGSTYLQSIEDLRKERRLLQVPGWNGDPVWTDASLQAMLLWFESWLATRHGAPRVIDATEGGVRKRGMQPMLLKEALEQYATQIIDVSGRLDALLAAWPGRKPEQVEGLCEAMRNAQRRLQRMAAQARVGRMLSQILENAVRQRNQAQVSNLLQRLNRVDRRLRVATQVDHFLALAIHPVAEFVQRAEAESRHDKWEVLVSRKSQLLYDGIVSTAESLVNWLAESEAGIRERFSLPARHSTGGVA